MYKYPYGDSQQLNLDWIIATLKELEASGGADLEEVSNALISLTYNTSTAYRRYDYAFLNGKLYRCLTDTSGVFNPTAWQEALIGDDLAVLTRWINAIDAAAVVDVKFDTTGTNGKIQQKYHDQYHDVVEVDYTPVQNSKRPLSSNAGYELNGAINGMKLFNSLTQLGLSSATTTLAIAQAMPDNSIFISDQSAITDTPTITWGTLEIVRKSNSRWFAKYYSQQLAKSDDAYFEYGKSGTNTAATNWQYTGSVNGIVNYILNKKIAIFGDSWSDENISWSSTVNDVWVKTFRDIAAPYNPTITNYSRSSRGFCRKDNNNQYTGLEIIQNTDLTNIDTVIIQMGLNDFLNGVWVGACTNNNTAYMWGALNAIEPYLTGKNVFVITPAAVSSRGTNTVACATLELFRIVLANWCKHCGYMLINGTTCPQIQKGSTAYDGSHIKNAYQPIFAQHIFSKIVQGGEVFSPLKEILTYVPTETVNNVETFNGVTISYNIDSMEALVDWVATAEGSTSGGSFTMPSFSKFVQRYLTINFANHVMRTSYVGSGNTANPPQASLYFAQFDQYATGSDVRMQWTNKGWSDILGYST